ncbi:MAG: EamA family transporter [Ilumatobacter sp.]|nr:EamA family transporter [Ilumatobacter sp.]
MSALFALAAAIGWGSSDFAAGYASRRSSAVSVVILTHFAALLVLLVFAVDLGPVWTMCGDLVATIGPGDGGGSIRWGGPGIAGTPTTADIGWGIAAGLGGGVGAMLLFRGLGKGSMAVVAPITAAGAAVIPVLFGLATGDPVTVVGIAGIGLALFAIVLVSLGGPETSDAATGPVAADGASPFRPPPPPHHPAASGGSDTALLVARPTIESPAVPHGATVAFRRALLALMAVAGLCAGAIAMPALDALLVHGELTGSDAAGLVLAVAIVGLAAFALHRGAPLLDAMDHERRMQAVGSRTAPRAADRSWRAIIRQPGVTEALFSGLGFGLFFVFIYRASEAAGHWPLVGARLVSVVLFVVIASATATALLPDRASRPPVILAGLLDAAAAIFFVMSTRVGLLSVGAVIAALYPVATVVLARVITKERIRRQQLTGLVLALVAVGLLAV